ncbi:ATP-binding protein [Streptomyces sp. NPDC051014]|uniref:AlbA family DNA-binding domain-containing protein n=1 Tax=Streptomyces sp. NPDC051014 TaxID=3155751 RepID=UPI0033DA0B2F
MALPARLTAALGRHPDDLTEDNLQCSGEPDTESVDLDWKKDFYKGTDAGKKELAKDMSAMPNTAGGMVIIGVHHGDQDHARALAPFEPEPGRGEEWIRSVCANRIQPIVPNAGVRQMKSASTAVKINWVLTASASARAPHAAAAPGNDNNIRVQHGTTTRTLAESEIAQRYRDRFQAASDDIDRLHQVADAGLGYLPGLPDQHGSRRQPQVDLLPGLGQPGRRLGRLNAVCLSPGPSPRARGAVWLPRSLARVTGAAVYPNRRVTGIGSEVAKHPD